MADATKEIEFEFLTDDPEEADQFSGGGHQRSARALANAIVKFSNDDRSIGLEGTWGSGKTTVVTIAERELGNSHPDKFTFFTFDLWANQSIEFRRGFLEGFLDWSKQYLSESVYKELEKRVRGKTKTVDTKSERQFSIFGYMLMASLFFLPFLVLWASPFSANLHINSIPPSPEADPIELPWLFQILQEYGHVAASGIIGLLAIGFVLQTTYLWYEKESLRKALDGSFSLFARKSDIDTVTQTIRDGDPTQYEFHEIFTEILSLVQRGNRRVVFVFDNLDRLPTDHIQEMWSNVRSVFSRDSYQKKPTEAVVTAVVPYDRQHVLSVFEGADKENSGSVDEDAQPANSPYMLEDVFRKTFSAVISVAPPITSDVENFFNQSLDGALAGQLESGHKHRLFQIFDLFLTEKRTNPTPRQVKSFINDVGMLWYQWQGKISIEAIAIFVLHRASIEADPKSLQKSDTINNRYRHFTIKPNLDSELAALAYNVEPDIALEVLLERDVVAALRNPENEQLLKLAESPGFKIQLDRILNQNCSGWASGSLEDFKTALSNYTELPLDPAIKELCDKHFTNAIPNLAKLDVSAWEDHKPLFQIASCMTKTTAQYHMKEIAQWVNNNLPEERNQDIGRCWINFVGGFVREIGNLHGEEVASSAATAIHVPYSPDFYLGVALDCDEVSLKFSQFRNSAGSKSSELSNAIANFGKQQPQNFRYVWRELLFALKAPEKATVFEELLDLVQTDILEGSKKRQDGLENLVLITKSDANYDNYAERIQRAIVDGSLPWHAFKFNEAEKWEGLANSIWLANIALGTGAVPGLAEANKPPFGDVSAAHAWFSKTYAGPVPDGALHPLANLVVQQKRIDNWVLAFAKSPKHALYGQVLETILGSTDCPALDIATVAQTYPVLKKYFDDEPVAAMIKQVGSATPDDQLEQIDLSSLPPLLINDIGNAKEGAWIKLLQRVDRHLKALTQDDWTEALTTENQNRKLLFARGSNLEGQIPPNQLSTPLADFIAATMASSDTPAEEISRHQMFWSALSQSSRNGLAKNLVEKISDKPVAIEGIEAAMSAFPGLFAEIPLLHRPETVITKLLIPLLGRDPDRALSFVALNSQDWAKCIENTTSEMCAEINDYLAGYDDREELQSQIEELRRHLNLEKPEKAPEPIPEKSEEASESDQTDKEN